MLSGSIDTVSSCVSIDGENDLSRFNVTVRRDTWEACCHSNLTKIVMFIEG